MTDSNRLNHQCDTLLTRQPLHECAWHWLARAGWYAGTSRLLQATNAAGVDGRRALARATSSGPHHSTQTTRLVLRGSTFCPAPAHAPKRSAKCVSGTVLYLRGT